MKPQLLDYAPETSRKLASEIIDINPKRKENETFEEYKQRRKKVKYLNKRKYVFHNHGNYNKLNNKKIILPNF